MAYMPVKNFSYINFEGVGVLINISCDSINTSILMIQDTNKKKKFKTFIIAKP